jgi:hypothetical protein
MLPSFRRHTTVIADDVPNAKNPIKAIQNNMLMVWLARQTLVVTCR